MSLTVDVLKSLVAVSLALCALHCSGTSPSSAPPSTGPSTNDGSSCTPDCDGATCGSDGCGGTCGTCSSGKTCSSSRTCSELTSSGSSCTPECSGKTCGADGCGGTCGDCSTDETCTAGKCVATKTCAVVVWASASNRYTDDTAIPYAPDTANQCDSTSDCCKGGTCVVGLFNPQSQGYCVARCTANSDCSTGCCDQTKGWCRGPHTGCGI